MITQEEVLSFIHKIEELLEKLPTLPENTDSSLSITQIITQLNTIKEALKSENISFEKTAFLALLNPFLNYLREEGNRNLLKQDRYKDVIGLIQDAANLLGMNYLHLLYPNLTFPEIDSLTHLIAFERYNSIPLKEFCLFDDIYVPTMLHVPTIIDDYIINGRPVPQNYSGPSLRSLSTPHVDSLEEHLENYFSGTQIYDNYQTRKQQIEYSRNNFLPSRELLYSVAIAAISGYRPSTRITFLNFPLAQQISGFFYARLNELINELPEAEKNLLMNYPVSNPFFPSSPPSSFGETLRRINAGSCTTGSGPYLLRFVLDFVEPNFKFSDLRSDYETVTNRINQTQEPHQIPFSSTLIQNMLWENQSAGDYYITHRNPDLLQFLSKGCKTLNNPLLQSEVKELDDYISQKSSQADSFQWAKKIFKQGKGWKISGARALAILIEKLDAGKSEFTQEDFNAFKPYITAFSTDEQLRYLFFTSLNHFNGEFAEAIKNKVKKQARMTTEADYDFLMLKNELRKKSEDSMPHLDELLKATTNLFNLNVSEEEKIKLLEATRATDTYLFSDAGNIEDYARVIEELNSSLYPNLKIVAGILLVILAFTLLAATLSFLGVVLIAPAVAAVIIAPLIELIGSFIATPVILGTIGVLGGGVLTFFGSSLSKEGITEIKVGKALENIKDAEEESLYSSSISI